MTIDGAFARSRALSTSGPDFNWDVMGTARFTEGAQTALRCEPLNQEYDPLKGDSLVAATRTEKGLDYVRL